MESQPVPNIDHLLTNIGRTGTSQGEVSGNTLAGRLCGGLISLSPSLCPVGKIVNDDDDDDASSCRPSFPCASLAVGTRLKCLTSSSDVQQHIRTLVGKKKNTRGEGQ